MSEEEKKNLFQKIFDNVSKQPEIVNELSRNFRSMPYEKQSMDMCIAAIQENPMNIQYVRPDKMICFMEIPREKLTTLVCEKAVEHYPAIFSKVPDELKTKDMCMKAVEHDGGLLRHVPEELCDEKICAAAVKNNIKGAFDYVPDDKLTEKMCIQHINLAWTDFHNSLVNLPENMKTKNVCLEAVKHSGIMYVDCPKKLLTDHDICRAAVVEGGLDMRYISESVRKDKTFQFSCLPHKEKTYDVCMNMVSENGKALQFVPEELKTPEMCMKAFENDRSSCMYMAPNMALSVGDLVKKKNDSKEPEVKRNTVNKSKSI